MSYLKQLAEEKKYMKVFEGLLQGYKNTNRWARYHIHSWNYHHLEVYEVAIETLDILKSRLESKDAKRLTKDITKYLESRVKGLVKHWEPRQLSDTLVLSISQSHILVIG